MNLVEARSYDNRGYAPIAINLFRDLTKFSTEVKAAMEALEFKAFMAPDLVDRAAGEYDSLDGLFTRIARCVENMEEIAHNLMCWKPNRPDWEFYTKQLKNYRADIMLKIEVIGDTAKSLNWFSGQLTGTETTQFTDIFAKYEKLFSSAADGLVRQLLEAIEKRDISAWTAYPRDVVQSHIDTVEEARELMKQFEDEDDDE